MVAVGCSRGTTLRTDLFSTGGVPTGADAAPRHATGVFIPHYPRNPMTKNTKKPRPPEDDGRQHGLDRLDADPPYGSTAPHQVKSFRQLLAELIAKQILNKRRDRKDNDNKIEP